MSRIIATVIRRRKPIAKIFFLRPHGPTGQKSRIQALARQQYSQPLFAWHVAESQIRKTAPISLSYDDMKHVARQLLSQARIGAPEGPARCDCCLCGESPYASAGPWRRVLGSNFVDFASFVSRSADICAGCQALLAGMPGSDPPPLRMTSLIATASGLRILDKPGIWAQLRRPHSDDHVISWAIGKKVHHWLRAGLSRPDRLEVGSDRGTIVYVPRRDSVLLDAVDQLLSHPGVSRAAVVSGDYHPKTVNAVGAARWGALERVVAAYRPTPLLDLVVSCCPREATTHPNEDPMIDPHDQIAAKLVSQIAAASRYRAQHGKEFWSGWLRHRIERYRQLPLNDFVSRLMDACETLPTAESSLEAVRALAALSDGETESIQRAIRERPALIVSLAYEETRA